MENLNSLPSGNYWISNSSVNRSPYNINYDIDDAKRADGFGVLKHPNDNTICVDRGLFLKCNGTDNQKYRLTMDGRIYSKVDGFVRTNFTEDPTGGLFSSMITTMRPDFSPTAVSLWNETAPRDGEGNARVYERWFNKPLLGTTVCGNAEENTTRGACSCVCEKGAGSCPTGTRAFANEDCSILVAKYYEPRTRKFCVKDSWQAENKDLCARGDISVKTVDGKLDIDKCKLQYKGDVCGKNYEPVSDGAWAPWSRETVNSPSTIKFCSQHDAVAGKPFLDSQNYPKCMDWCKNNEQLCIAAKNNYCRDYPLNPVCPEYCEKNNNDPCREIFKKFCVGKNLESDSCKKFCSNLPNPAYPYQPVNTCDEPLKAYCKELIALEGMTPEKLQQIGICDCFMPGDFYEVYKKGIEKDVEVPSVLLAECIFGPCAVSSLKPYLQRQRATKCPSEINCVQAQDYTFQGDTRGRVKISNDIACGNLRDPDTKCKLLTQFRSGTDCVDCKGVQDPKNPKATDITLLKGGTLANYKNTCICLDQTKVYNRIRGTCDTCPEGSKLNTDRTECVCLEGLELNHKLNKCVKKCAGGSYYDVDLGDCKEGIVCQLPEILNEMGTACFTPCEKGYHYENGSCHKDKITCEESQHYDEKNDRCVENTSESSYKWLIIIVVVIIIALCLILASAYFAYKRRN
ncbi:MAG: hypothetical protein Harvfovirus8_28 [Harvfovirus sp.]|uniref:Uncharacterized protein n=1 Tax=Harvfovirus sp. TaxID=2487768 RepID=A0A3G5A0Y7_9VIRU|nr:MAG: hypothetical protein Harvfovirus8_28 [Harvfovirus sp.]